MNRSWVRILATSFLAGLPVAVFAQQLNSPLAAPARFLTVDTNATDYWPCFSPDGSTVLFSRSTDDGKTWKLFVVPSTSTDIKFRCGCQW